MEILDSLLEKIKLLMFGFELQILFPKNLKTLSLLVPSPSPISFVSMIPHFEQRALQLHLCNLCVCNHTCTQHVASSTRSHLIYYAEIHHSVQKLDRNLSKQLLVITITSARGNCNIMHLFASDFTKIPQV